MSKFFVLIYNFLEKKHWCRNILLIGTFLLLVFFAVQVKFEEDVTRFFPDTQDAKNSEIVFKNLKVKDKIILMLSASDSTNTSIDADALIVAGNALEERLMEKTGPEYISKIFSTIDQGTINHVIDSIYSNLPIFMNDADFARLDSLIIPENIDARMKSNFMNMISPAGVGLRNIIPRDPLGVGTSSFEKLRDMQVTANYTIYDNHIFSKDMSTLLIFLDPTHGMGSTGKNDYLIDAIESELGNTMAENSGIRAEYFGGPSVGVYNARQIKADTMLTLTIALIIIIAFIFIVFKSKSAIMLIILPVIYGATFALGAVFLIKGSISAIAIGAGAAVFGIALSYSIHVLSHFNHVTSTRQLIEELSYPLTVGSFTTVGAFMGLVFTSSEILRDFGLFSSLALIGTTIFCLIFLPHFLKPGKETKTSGRVLRVIERINGYAFEKNKYLVWGLVIVFCISIFLSNDVKFDSNMMNLSFEPKHIKASEERLNSLFQSDNKTTLIISIADNEDEALNNYANTNNELAKLKEKNIIKEYASAENILISPSEQKKRIERWNNFWTPERKTELVANVNKYGAAYNFREGTFDKFFEVINKNYTPCDFVSDSSIFPFINEWTTFADSSYMYITQVRLDDAHKEDVYEQLGDNEGIVIFDRGYFANKWVSAINDDFYLILYISSFLIFFVLLVSYGRIELTLMTFTPMAVSWIIILGLMAITGTEFNIVNIILATFIFGLGDDFSIFIMDGLQQEYRTGKKMLTSHKTAIFFSSFTAVVGLGVLVFAKHPALQSISVISILGMISVVLVSYTVLPILFNFFIARPAKKGCPPYTFFSFLCTIWFYGLFVLGCILMMVSALLLLILPIRKKTKKLFFGQLISRLSRLFLKSSAITRFKFGNESNEDFKKPAVIIANHQSFLDIIMLLGLYPKLVMVTNNWVYHSPFFGKIVQYADFVKTADGYEKVLDKLKKKVEQGYSVVIFPEGSRSYDCKLKRFHKGAFYVAQELKLDILPIMLYGTGMIVSKRQPFYVKPGVVAVEILNRIPYEDKSWGETYQERTKSISRWYKSKYNEVVERYSTTSNPYFYKMLVANYIYKGPVEEWYVRVKVKMEHKYKLFNDLVPKEARITDIGCGLGTLPYMLMMLSDKREILGIDYDEDKINVARHNFSRNDRISFKCADVEGLKLEQSDVFIISDMLHYISYEKQARLLSSCIDSLSETGMMIIRDGNASNEEKHKRTRFTEFLSTKFFRFNKIENNLYFPETSHFEKLASDNNLSLEVIGNDAYTSNTIYILRKEVSRG